METQKTDLSQDENYDNFKDWYSSIKHRIIDNFPNYCIFQAYFNQGLTPEQALNEFFK